MDLISIDDLKVRLDIDHSKEDAVLQDIISGMSAIVENHLDRQMTVAAATDFFNVAAGAAVFSLKAYPITVDPVVYNDIQWNYNTAMSTTLYTWDPETGLLSFFGDVLVPGLRALKVTYTGGLGANAAAIKTNYRDLYEAVLRQCIATFDLNPHYGKTSRSAGDGSSVAMDSRALIPEVERILEPFRRYTYG